MTSWKTTLAGILTVLPQILHLAFPKLVSAEVAVALSTLFAAGGLGVAKDSNVTGGTVVNATNDANVVASSATTSTASSVPVQPAPPTVIGQ